MPRLSPEELGFSASGARVIPSRGCTLCKTCPPPAPLNRSSRFAAGTVTASCSTTRCSWCSSSRLHQHHGFYWIPPRPRTLYHLIGLLRPVRPVALHAAFRRVCDTLRGCAHRRDRSTSCRRRAGPDAHGPGEPSHYDYLASDNAARLQSLLSQGAPHIAPTNLAQQRESVVRASSSCSAR